MQLTALTDGAIRQLAEVVSRHEKNTNLDQLISDVRLGIELFGKFKNEIDGLHPLVLHIIKLLI
jgi:hypothetical protein